MTESDEQGVEPTDVVPDWDSDPALAEREAAPPDGVDQDWRTLHPGGAAELGYEVPA